MQHWYEAVLVYLNVIVYYGLPLCLILSSALYYFRKRRRKLRQRGGSVLLNYYTDGGATAALHHGKIGTMHYIVMANSATNAAFYQIELPFSANIHLLSIPRQDAVRLNPAGRGSVLEPVVLEGDYPDTFMLYGEKGKQAQARYVLNPKAMAFMMDFCTSHSWEIIDNSLYFVQTTSQAESDKTTMFEDIAGFVEEITPRIGDPLTDAQRNQAAPYGHDRRNNLLCPICQQVMENHDTYYSCTQGHGILLSGGALMDLRKGQLVIRHSDGATAASTERGAIVCPSCGAIMHRVPYNGNKKIVIDSCSGCPYRWVDSAEIKEVV